MLAPILLAWTLLAQTPPAGAAGGPPPAPDTLAIGGWHLPRNLSVLAELKASNEQARALEALIPVVSARYKAAMDGVFALPPEQVGPRARALTLGADAELRGVLNQVLRPEQVARYDQLVLRAAGFRAFSAIRVRAALKLTNEQEAKLVKIAKELDAAWDGVEESKGSSDAAHARLAELNRRAVDEFQPLMSPEQKAAWQGLVGEAFELEEDPVAEPR